MKKVVFATNNANKLEEIQSLLGDQFKLLSLAEIGFDEEIPETQATIEGNASQKANYIFDRFKVPVFADDTGLEVEALNGEPGVYSARYSAPNPNSEKNMDKVLSKLQGESNRNARFKTVIAWIDEEGKEMQFEGLVEGEILLERTGSKGFGYDPIFKPLGFEQSFAEMSMEEKNKISHRGRAFRKLVRHLTERTS